jgi:hypothetical protein
MRCPLHPCPQISERKKKVPAVGQPTGAMQAVFLPEPRRPVCAPWATLDGNLFFPGARRIPYRSRPGRHSRLHGPARGGAALRDLE